MNSGSASPRRTRTPEPSTTSKNLDPELSSFFLVRRATTETHSISPRFPDSGRIKPTSHRSQKSGESSTGRGGRPPSITSSLSTTSKFKDISEWNNKSYLSDTSPCSYDRYNSRHPADPPRQPREGYEWVWFPEGYWAEREFRDPIVIPKRPVAVPNGKQKWWRTSPEHRKSKSSGITELGNKTPPPPMGIEVPKIKIGSILVPNSKTGSEVKNSRKSSKASGNNNTGKSMFGLAFIRPPAAESYVSSQELEEEPLSLYKRAKKNIRSRLASRGKLVLDDSSLGSAKSAGLRSRTSMLLEGTSRYFDKLQKERQTSQMRTKLATETPQTPGSVVSRGKRSYGLAPWHHRNSHESLFSISSSVHRLLMGKTPIATPAPEPRFADIEGKDHQGVDIARGDSHDPSFLSSKEARRIFTPPMGPGTPVARGFFFDLAGPKDETDSESYSPAISTGSESTSAKREEISPTRVWREANKKHPKTNKSAHSSPNRKVLRAQGPEISPLELNLPEHLPSSPLCPKNPKHVSGGSGMCEYHGRRSSVKLKNLKRANTGSSGAGGGSECL